MGNLQVSPISKFKTRLSGFGESNFNFHCRPCWSINHGEGPAERWVQAGGVVLFGIDVGDVMGRFRDYCLVRFCGWVWEFIILLSHILD